VFQFAKAGIISFASFQKNLSLFCSLLAKCVILLNPFNQKTITVKKLLLLSFILPFFGSLAQKNTNKPALEAVKVLLKTLTDEQLKKTVFPYDTDERRNWFYIPTERKGLPLLEMTEPQKQAAIQLLKTSMSQQASDASVAIMQLEIILKKIENLPPDNHRRHPEKYYFSIFGTPNPQTLWGWRIEGHHISLNFTAESGKIVSATPQFFGSNPAIVPNGYPEAGKQIFKQEEVLGFDFLNSLNTTQRQKAIVSDKCPWEIFSSNLAHVMVIDTIKTGLSYKDMTKEQQQKLVQMVAYYVRRYPKGFADEFMNKIETAGLNNLIFTWMGAKEPNIGNGGHYYRIQNPVLWIEYDNTQNNANHIHTVIRDLTNDFGEDMLKRHYATGEH
jgi:hypothetical protein